MVYFLKNTYLFFKKKLLKFVEIQHVSEQELDIYLNDYWDFPYDIDEIFPSFNWSEQRGIDAYTHNNAEQDQILPEPVEMEAEEENETEEEVEEEEEEEQENEDRPGQLVHQVGGNIEIRYFSIKFSRISYCRRFGVNGWEMKVGLKNPPNNYDHE